MSETIERERLEAHEDEFGGRTRPWWVPWAAALVAAVLTVGVGSYFVYGRDTVPASMRGDMAVPPARGFFGGEEVRFMHTEASDPEVARLLTRMMGSPVVLVPSLADVPRSALADVFVFTNGVEGDGPMGFQPDVFDSVPGQRGYRPLRQVNLVTWNGDRETRELRSIEEIESAVSAGEVTIERTAVVVNMPTLRWPGGSR